MINRPKKTKVGRIVPQPGSKVKKNLQVEQNRATDADHESHEWFRTVLYCIGDAVITTDAAGRIQQMNPVAEQLTGWREAEALGQPLAQVFRFINEDTRIEGENPVERVLREGKVAGLVNHTLLIARDGTERPIAGSGATIRNGKGEITGMVLVFRDQTQERATQKALRESEETFRAIAENANDGIFITVGAGVQAYANKRAAEITGYSVAELLKTGIKDLVHPDEVQKITERYRRRLAGEHVPPQYETVIVKKDGKSAPIELTATKTVWQRQPADLVIIRDITERRRAEEALRESEERFRSAVEHWPSTFVIYDRERRIRFINTYGIATSGLPRDKILGRRDEELFPAEVTRSYLPFLEEAVKTRSTQIAECTMTRRGRDYNIVVSYVPLLDDDGEIRQILGVAHDITSRKAAEDALRDSEKKYRNIFDNAVEGIFQTTPEGRCLSVNPAFARMFGYSSPEEVIWTITDIGSQLYADAEVRRHVARRLTEEGAVANFEAQVRRKDGSLFWISINARTVRDNKGKVLFFEGTNEDITARKRQDEHIRASLVEKEMLLKEIHHRVKNNLQIVSSLLKLQAADVSDLRIQGILNDAQNRIWSMALIHEKLYQSENLARIDMNDYIRSLLGGMASAYGDPNATVKMKIDIGDISFSIDKVIPLAVIINELVSNIFKHAFPNSRHGIIKIELKVEKNIHMQGAIFTLVIADNGIGLPDDIDPIKAKTLGLQLVSILTRQINGLLRINRSSGTEFKITFSEN